MSVSHTHKPPLLQLVLAVLLSAAMYHGRGHITPLHVHPCLHSFTLVIPTHAPPSLLLLLPSVLLVHGIDQVGTAE